MAEQEPRQLELFEEKLLAPESREHIRLVGQIFDTYWLAQFGDNFYIIDQHAAHEKVYYERLVKSFREKTVDSQYLNPPLIVTLNLQEENILKENQKYFSQFGFEIEEFGGKEYRISACLLYTSKAFSFRELTNIQRILPTAVTDVSGVHRFLTDIWKKKPFSDARPVFPPVHQRNL